MKTISKLLMVVLTAIAIQINAQDFQGIATYKTHTKMDLDLKMDSTKVNDQLQKLIMEQMEKQFQKTYQLSFNKEESLYKVEESLDAPQKASDGVEVSFEFSGFGGDSDVLYKNTKTQKYSEQKDIYGKMFLVKDELQKKDWKLESETKYIGEYQCYKATYTKQVPDVENIDFSNASGIDEIPESKLKMKDVIVTAWYTPQIPVSNGPSKYQGLPGLILEVHDGKQTIVCSKIVLNPEKKIEISEPKKGKVVNEKKYYEILNKKHKQMDNDAGRKNNGDGEVIFSTTTTTIGG